MKYIPNNYDPQQAPKVGVLITNLGTPDAAEKKPLRRYLKEFLSDPRVVEVPRLLWWLILNVVILNIRPRRSAAAYRSVWTEQGSPLLLHTRAQAAALQDALSERLDEEIKVDFAMRYGSPGISAVMQKMQDEGVRKLLVLPLYPQYSGPAAGSTFDAIAADFSQRRWVPQLRFVSDYHDHESYIAALALSIRNFQAQHGQPDRLLFSFHGEPQRYVDEGDPYFQQCMTTTRLVAEMLDLEEGSYMTTFQSRFGREEWLKPYTDHILKALPGEGVKSVQVICPGFSADCLETLEEIAVENRDYFLQAGGENYAYIPCLNSDAGHISALTELVSEELGGWIGAPR